MVVLTSRVRIGALAGGIRFVAELPIVTRVRLGLEPPPAEAGVSTPKSLAI